MGQPHDYCFELIFHRKLSVKLCVATKFSRTKKYHSLCGGDGLIDYWRVEY
jgi:hypothetical protein